MEKKKVVVDHYKVLGLPSGEAGSKLNEQQIRKAYRAKALQLHPDKRPDDPNAKAKFQNLTSSYEILMNPKARKQFDSSLRLDNKPPPQPKRQEASEPKRKASDEPQREASDEPKREASDEPKRGASKISRDDAVFLLYGFLFFVLPPMYFPVGRHRYFILFTSFMVCHACDEYNLHKQSVDSTIDRIRNYFKRKLSKVANNQESKGDDHEDIQGNSRIRRRILCNTAKTNPATPVLSTCSSLSFSFFELYCIPRRMLDEPRYSGLGFDLTPNVKDDGYTDMLRLVWY